MDNTNSSLITAAEAGGLPVDTGLLDAPVRVAQGVVEVADGDFDADGDTVKLARLPARARIHSIKTWCDALDAGTDSVVNVGVYATDGTVKDEDAFATLVTTFQSADTTGTEHRFEAADIDTLDDELHTFSGDSEGDEMEYDIVLTQTAAVTTDAAGTISFLILYTMV